MTGILTIPAADYHADPADQPSLSATIANTLCASSPKHAWTQHPKLNPDYRRTDDDKFDLGTVAHSLLLEGEAAVRVVYADDWRTKEAKGLRDEARANGQTALLEKHWAAVQQMVAAVREQLDRVETTPPLFTDGLPEQTLLWQEAGVWCRARLDWLRDDFTACDDLKTTSASANPERWQRTLYGIGADLQAAFYLRGLRAVTGVDAEFRFVVVETYPPFALSVVSLAPSALALANEKVDYALATWRRCLETGVWPAYLPRVAHVEMPSWEEMRWLERDAREGAAA